MRNLINQFAVLSGISASLLFSGCTANQQDSIFESAINLARESVGFEVKTQLAEDVTLTYMERPSSIENGESILLLHGFSANKDSWIRFTKALDKKYHVIAVDLAGHGDSEKLLTTDYGLIKQAERLDALMINLGVEQFHIVGNSMGGAISAIYSLDHPEKIKSLTLIAAAGIDGVNTSEFYKSLAKGNNSLIATDEASFDYRMDITMSQPPMLPWPLYPALVRKTLARAELNQEIFTDMLTTKEKYQTINFQQMIQTTIAQHRIPTLIMWGKEDRVLDVSAAAAFKEVIPTARMHIFEDVGHLPMLEVPNESANVYQQFLSTIE